MERNTLYLAFVISILPILLLQFNYPSLFSTSVVTH